jgi:hypothetical protein
MDMNKLSDYQLYELAGNRGLNRHIRQLARKELALRGPDAARFKEFASKHEQVYGPRKGHIPAGLKFVLVVIPALVVWLPVFVLIYPEWYPAFLQDRKWRQCWLFAMIGYVGWMSVGILYFSIYCRSCRG